MECPTKLFYANKPDIYKNVKGENEFLESLAEGGFQVGKMATLLYPNGIEIQEREKVMFNAAQNLEFEKAASVRDEIELLRKELLTVS